MADVKLVVMYPRPKDVDVFEKIYQHEHVPLAVAKLGGKTKIVATKILGSPQGTPPFYRIAEVYFPSMQALEACAASGRDLHVHQNSKCLGETDAFQTINHWAGRNFCSNDDTLVSIHSCCEHTGGAEPR